MRLAIISDVHGNWAALQAVVAHVRIASPDLVLHGGDLADGGASPAAVVDCIRGLGWQGVLGNTDEMLFDPDSLRAFAARHAHLRTIFDRVEEMAEFTRAALGAERLAWLKRLPRVHTTGDVALLHGTPHSPWTAPPPEASDAELDATYGPLAKPLVVYGHIHRPYIRHLTKFILANAGSVGLPYDGDNRAAYLLCDGGVPAIQRVEYDVESEARALSGSGLPHGEWVVRLLRAARFQMP